MVTNKFLVTIFLGCSNKKSFCDTFVTYHHKNYYTIYTVPHVKYVGKDKTFTTTVGAESDRMYESKNMTNTRPHEQRTDEMHVLELIAPLYESQVLWTSAEPLSGV